jgi:hypothetical protein
VVEFKKKEYLIMNTNENSQAKQDLAQCVSDAKKQNSTKSAATAESIELADELLKAVERSTIAERNNAETITAVINWFLEQKQIPSQLINFHRLVSYLEAAKAHHQALSNVGKWIVASLQDPKPNSVISAYHSFGYLCNVYNTHLDQKNKLLSHHQLKFDVSNHEFSKRLLSGAEGPQDLVVCQRLEHDFNSNNALLSLHVYLLGNSQYFLNEIVMSYCQTRP